MTTKQIKTVEEDSGLWSVWRGATRIGFIWEPEAERRIMSKFAWGKKLYASDPPVSEPRFVALDDWVDGIAPGNPLEGCAKWHQALHAVCDWAKQQQRRQDLIAERRAIFSPRF